ncbi:MAG: NAD-dependent epimerase/dehydratase family protein [Desulfurobacteriaceae bacterium]
MKRRKKNILIAGGAGFIGSHLCERLVIEGYNVYCLDNLSSGTFENIKHLEKEKNFRFYEYDIVKSVFDPGDIIDEIYHLASPASPKDYREIPVETALANSVGTLNLLKLAVKHKAKFLFASTSEVYGNPLEHPQTEEYVGIINHLSIRASYAESKRFGEMLVYLFRRKYFLDTKIVRIFNTYGPRMRINDGRVIPTFICHALADKNIVVYGDGQQICSFCYVDDIVNGLLKVMDCNYHKPINLGNPNEEISIYSLALKIKDITKSKSRILFMFRMKDSIERRKPDISKAIKLLNIV